MIILAAAIFDDYAGVGYAVELSGISKLLPDRVPLKLSIASILPEFAVGNATGADALVLQKCGQVLYARSPSPVGTPDKKRMLV
jgi:hypothetical protein